MCIQGSSDGNTQSGGEYDKEQQSHPLDPELFCQCNISNTALESVRGKEDFLSEDNVVDYEKEDKDLTEEEDSSSESEEDSSSESEEDNSSESEGEKEDQNSSQSQSQATDHELTLNDCTSSDTEQEEEEPSQSQRQSTSHSIALYNQHRKDVERFDEWKKLRCDCHHNCYEYLGFALYNRETTRASKFRPRDKAQLVYSLIDAGAFSIDSSQPPSPVYTIGQVVVCKDTWCLIYKINARTIVTELKNYKPGKKTRLHMGTSLRRPGVVRRNTVRDAFCMANDLGETIPGGEIHVPNCVTKAEFYKYLVKLNPLITYLKKTAFYGLFKNELRKIKFPKNTTLGKCDTCLKLTNHYVSDPSKESREVFKRQKALHSEFIYAEKIAYAIRCKEAVGRPDTFLSLALDRSSSIRFPHTHPAPKMDKGKYKLSVWGCINHSNNKRRLVVVPPLYEDGPNLCISMLWTIIKKTLLTSEHRPTVLYLQMDNCVKENKNRFVLAFLAYLVYLGLFKRITASFLPPAHGHNDVDQLFSGFSPIRKLGNFFTIETLMEKIKDGFFSPFKTTTKRKPPLLISLLTGLYLPSSSPPKITYGVKTMWNWKEFLGCNLPNMSDFTKPLQFHFEMIDGKVACIPQNSAATNTTRGEPFFPLASAPTSSPTTVRPRTIPDDVIKSIYNMKKVETEQQKAYLAKYFAEINTQSAKFVPTQDDECMIVPRTPLVEPVVQNPHSDRHSPHLVQPGTPVGHKRRHPIKIGSIYVVRPDKDQITSRPYWFGVVTRVPYAPNLSATVKWLDLFSVSDDGELYASTDTTQNIFIDALLDIQLEFETVTLNDRECTFFSEDMIRRIRLNLKDYDSAVSTSSRRTGRRRATSKKKKTVGPKKKTKGKERQHPSSNTPRCPTDASTSQSHDSSAPSPGFRRSIRLNPTVATNVDSNSPSSSVPIRPPDNTIVTVEQLKASSYWSHWNKQQRNSFVNHHQQYDEPIDLAFVHILVYPPSPVSGVC